VTSGPLTDDRASDRDHLGVEIPLDATEPRRPDLVCSAQYEERHAGAAQLHHDHPLAPDIVRFANPFVVPLTFPAA
jgi:hypothetical protein